MKTLFSTLMIFLFCGTSYAGNCFVQSHSNIHSNNFIIKEKLVEFDSDYYLGVQGYYDVVNELKSEEIKGNNAVIQKQQDQLDRILGILEKILDKKLNETPSVEPSPEQPTPSEPTTPQPEQPTQPSQPDDDLDSQVYNIFSKNCAQCHDGSDSKRLQLIGETDGQGWLSDLSVSQRAVVYDLTSGINVQKRGYKLMPLGGPPLNDTDVETLRLWMLKKAREVK